MKSEELYRAIGNIDERIIREADAATSEDLDPKKYKGRPQSHSGGIWNEYTLKGIVKIAASVLLAAGLATGAWTLIRQSGYRYSGSSGSSGYSQPGGSTACSDACSDTGYYEKFFGEVMPLMIYSSEGEEEENVSAVRDVTYDFTEHALAEYREDNKDLLADNSRGEIAFVEDSYRITNESSEPVVINAAYPHLVKDDEELENQRRLTDPNNVILEKNGVQLESLISYGGSLDKDSVAGTHRIYSWENEADVIERDHSTFFNIEGDHSALNVMVYLKNTITIQPGETVALSYSFYQMGNSNYSGGTWSGANGYGLVTHVDDMVRIDQQNVHVKLSDRVEIIDQNLGLDISKGKLSAALNIENKYYYMIVRDRKWQDKD